MPFADLPTGVHLHYLDPYPSHTKPVLLLHGLGSSAQSWMLQMPVLAKAGFRPIAPDARGHGKTPYPGHWSVEAVAEDFSALLHHLDVPAAHVVGISMGGVLAQQLALSHPDQVRSLVLVNTFARLTTRGVGQMLYFLLRFGMLYLLGPQAQARVVAKRLFPYPGQEFWRQAFIDEMTQCDPRAYRAALQALQRVNLLPRLREIHAPTLIVTGEQDTTVPPALQEVLARAIPHARHVRIPDAGHALVVDQPEAFHRVLLDFLQQA